MTQENTTSIDEVIKNYAHLFASYGMFCNLAQADELFNESVSQLTSYVRNSVKSSAENKIIATNRLTTVEQLNQLPADAPVQGVDNRGMRKILAQKSENGVWSSTYKTPVSPEQLLMLCEKGFVVLSQKEDNN